MNFAVLIKAQVEQSYEYADYIYINITYSTFYIYFNEIISMQINNS